MSSISQVLHAQGAETVDGVSPGSFIEAVELSVAVALTELKTTPTGGTPLLDLEIEWSPDGANWGSAESADTFTQLAAAAVVAKRFTIKAPYHRLKWTIGGTVGEAQQIVHNHSSGNFTLSFDGQGPTSDIPWNAPVDSTFAQGTLTLDTIPIDGVASEGTLTLDTALTDGDTMTVDAKTYTFLDDITANEVQSLYNQATSGQFTISFDGEGPTGLLEWDAPNAPQAAKGTLTLAAEPVEPINAQGTLTLAAEPTDGDEFVVDAKTYTFETALTNVDGHIAIGGSLASAQANLEGAFDLSGTAGVDYAAAMTAHPTVSFGNFVTNAAVLTANDYGVAGNSIVTTETFFSGSNVFDATTLGTTTLGVAADTYTIDTKVYTFETILQDVDGHVFIGGSLAQAKLNLVAAIDLSGVAGTDYATSMSAHGSVDVAVFIVNDAILTAQVAGLASDAIATTETFADGGNVFDGTTLGVTLEGLNGLESELEALANISNVTITGAGTIGDPWIITFVSPGNEDVPLITADDTLLVGGTPVSVIAEETKGVSDADGVIAIGGSLAQSKLNLVAAFDLSGAAGTDYANAMTAHPTVDIATFIVNDAVLTAKTKGVAGDSIVTTEVFFTGTNTFDDTTLGTTTAGVANDTYTIDSKVYTFEETLTNVDGNVFIGGSLAQAKLNLVAAINLTGAAGTDYATLMTAHPTVDVAAFIVDDVILTARTAGGAGDLIATTETFFTGTNVFDATTLGAVTAGVYGVETELELLSNIDDVTVVRNGDGDWTVTWPFGVGDVALMTIDGSGLAGGSSAVVTETVVAKVASANFVAKTLVHSYGT